MVPNHDVFSFLGLIWQADPVVKIVIFCLLGFSVASWSIIFSKYFLFRRLQFESYTFEKSFQRSDNLSNLFNHFAENHEPPLPRS
jgi:biopolymer transport protein TolQ